MFIFCRHMFWWYNFNSSRLLQHGFLCRIYDLPFLKDSVLRIQCLCIVLYMPVVHILQVARSKHIFTVGLVVKVVWNPGSPMWREVSLVGNSGRLRGATEFSRDFFSEISSQCWSPKASKQASKQARKQASKQVGKQASQQASKQAKEGKEGEGGFVFGFPFFCFFLFSSLASVAFVDWAFVALPFFTCLSIYLSNLT